MLARLGGYLGSPDMFENAFRCAEYAEREPFTAAGFEVLALRVPHYELLAFGFRCTCDGKTLAYSGDTGPCGELDELAQDADLFLCEATLLAPNPEGGTRGHLASDEALDVFRTARRQAAAADAPPGGAPARPGARAGLRRDGGGGLARRRGRRRRVRGDGQEATP